MATVTIGNRSRDSPCSELDNDRQERVAIHAARVQAEFHSRADAREMGKHDVCNVRPLKPSEYEVFLKRLEVSNPKMYRQLMDADEEMWGAGWDSDDYRWELTPHALRRERELHRKGN